MFFPNSPLPFGTSPAVTAAAGASGGHVYHQDGRSFSDAVAAIVASATARRTWTPSEVPLLGVPSPSRTSSARRLAPASTDAASSAASCGNGRRDCRRHDGRLGRRRRCQNHHSFWTWPPRHCRLGHEQRVQRPPGRPPCAGWTASAGLKRAWRGGSRRIDRLLLGTSAI